MHRPIAVLPLLTLCLALALSACGKGTDRGVKTAAATGTQSAAAAPPGPAVAGCKRVAAPKPKQVALKRPTARLDRKKTYTVRLETSCGAIAIRLGQARQPRTAASFAYLVRMKVIDGVPFHRIVADFVIQGGDPLGTGEGSAGYTITEAPPPDARYPVGTVAMAKTEIERPGTSGSQFFIVTGKGAPLEPIYAVLGKVVGSRAAVDRIAGAPADPSSGMPDAPVVIEHATLTAK